MRSAAHPLKRTLVVGGVPAYVQGTLRKKLARWGFAVETHVPLRGSAAMAPRHDITRYDVVIILKELCPDLDVVDAWKTASNAHGVKPLVLTRKESSWKDDLKLQGYNPINPNTAAAVAVVHDEAEEDMAPPPTPINALAKHAPATPALPTPRTSQTFNDLMDQLQVVISELKDQGLVSLSWSPDKGLDAEAIVHTRIHKSL